MNISTYEARIKALEDQLNPPAPSGGGIVSVTVTPDIQLKMGQTLNSWLSDNLPIKEGNASKMLESQDGLINDTLYEVSATPGGNWCINAGGSSFGAPGSVMTGSTTVTNGALKIRILSASDPESHTSPHAQLNITVS